MTISATPLEADAAPRASVFSAIARAARALASNGSLLTGTIMCSVLVLLVTIGPSLITYDPQASTPDVLADPSASHWLGTDSIGRDVLARLALGARLSIFITMVSTLITMILSLMMGMTAGFHGGRVDWIEMRLVDILLAMPPLLVAIAVLAALGPSLVTLIAVLVVTYTPQSVRVIRAATLQLGQRGFIDAARISGVGPARIMWIHILPNIRGVLIVKTTITLAHMMLVETILSFLGLGVQPPTPSLGFMLAEGRQWMELTPMVVIAPGLVVVFALATFTFLGQGVDEQLSRRT